MIFNLFPANDLHGIIFVFKNEDEAVQAQEMLCQFSDCIPAVVCYGGYMNAVELLDSRSS